MKKRISVLFFILALVFCMAGCTPKIVPNPEVEAYLNTGLTAQQAMEAVKTASYRVEEIQTTKTGTQLGKALYEVFIDLSDANALRLTIQQSLSGSYAEDGITQKSVRLEKVDGKYLYTTVNGEQRKEETVEDSFARDYVASFFYTNNEAYNEGGLYYGDYFMLFLYKYPATAFYVDGETNLCVFDEKMEIHNANTGLVYLHQISKINVHGLLESNYERYESVEQDLILTSTLTASYT